MCMAAMCGTWGGGVRGQAVRPLGWPRRAPCDGLGRRGGRCGCGLAWRAPRAACFSKLLSTTTLGLEKPFAAPGLHSSFVLEPALEPPFFCEAERGETQA